ncbi:unnamed protein product [Cochlearia groenlandica]
MSTKKQDANVQPKGLALTYKKRPSNPTKTNNLVSSSFGSPSSTEVINIDDDDEDDYEPKSKQRLGFRRENIEVIKELGSVSKGSSNLNPKEKGNGVDSSLTSHHHDGEIASEKGNRHVSLDDLGVTVEELKSMPWEAIDPAWEIRSDLWLGRYVRDIKSPDP